MFKYIKNKKNEEKKDNKDDNKDILDKLIILFLRIFHRPQNLQRAS